MKRAELVWLVVAYNNLEEVESFVERIDPVGGDSFGWAICDNSAQASAGEARQDGVIYLCRPDNPGYLEGALTGLDEWVREAGQLPEWAVVSNTDLDLISGNPLDHLKSYDPDEKWIIAPRIVEGSSPAVEKNPHVLKRRSRSRLQLNHLLTCTTLFAWAYLVASLLKQRFRARATDVSVASGESESGTSMYAPYGAMIFLSRGFLAERALPRYVPLMSEEFFVAEAALKTRTPVLYEPKIHAHHSAHVTTGGKVSWRRAQAISNAFGVMYRQARAEDVA